MTEPQIDLIEMALFAISDREAAIDNDLIERVKSINGMSNETRLRYLNGHQENQYVARKIIRDAIARHGFFA